MDPKIRIYEVKCPQCGKHYFVDFGPMEIVPIEKMCEDCLNELSILALEGKLVY